MAKIRFALLVAAAILVLALWVHLGTGDFVTLLIGLAALALGLWAVKWAFWPRHHLPRNRIRNQWIRLRLRLHPGPGHATAWELHRHWGRRAAYKRAAQVRPS
jgi:hypothetical protein